MTISNNIYGIHEYSKEWHDWILQSGRDAWCLELTNLSEDYSGRDIRREKITNIVRLNWGYDVGTIPSPENYDEAARRCAEFVKNSQGIERVHVGNEPNITTQWDAPPSGPITFNQYVEYYNKVFDAIKAASPNVKVAPAPLATWAIAPEFGWYDWVDDTKRLLESLSHKVDFVTFHAYATSTDLDNFHKIIPMNPPFQHRTYSFAVLWEFMKVIPYDLRNVEVHLTETNMNTKWSENHTGRWIQTLYHYINEWNKTTSNQKILGALPFRWAAHDSQWDFSQDNRTIDDFRQSLQWDYRHNYQSNPPIVNPPPEVLPNNCARVIAPAGLNLRDAPINGKVIMTMPVGTVVTIHKVENGWSNVTIANTTTTGWSSSRYLK